MGYGTAGGLQHHPNWPPSWILLKLQNYWKMWKLQIFFARVVKYDICY